MDKSVSLKNKLITITIGTLAVIMVLSTVIGINLLLNENSPNSNNTSVNSTLSQYPDYYAIKGGNPDKNIKHVDITDICPKGGCISTTSAVIDFSEIDRIYKVTGNFSRAYLYISALVDYDRPLTSWDDIYFKINDIGGHLTSDDDNLLPVPPSQSSEYLYKLNSISYYPSLNNKTQKINENKNINLFNLLQNSIELHINVAISSARPGRVMKEISIYYECAQGSQCSIEEIKK
jgi:hypothetical protein